MWPCMLCSFVRGSLTPIRLGGVSTVGETQLSDRVTRKRPGGGKGWDHWSKALWKQPVCKLEESDQGPDREASSESSADGSQCQASPQLSPPSPPGKSSAPRRRANTSSLRLLCPVNSEPSSKVRLHPYFPGPHLVLHANLVA